MVVVIERIVPPTTVFLLPVEHQAGHVSLELGTPLFIGDQVEAFGGVIVTEVVKVTGDREP